MVASGRLVVLAASAAVAAGSASGSALPDLNMTSTATNSRQLQQLNQLRLFHFCGVDISYMDTKSVKASDPRDCVEHCKKASTCDSGTWTDYEGGTCWLKQGNAGLYNYKPNAGSYSFAWFRKEGSNSHANKPYVAKVGPDMDMAGFDAGSTSCPTPAECGNQCAGLIQCFAATWTNHNGGTCWFKSRASGFIAKAGAHSFVIARPDQDWWHDCPRLT